MVSLNNWKLIVEYDGSSFCGWQSQPQNCGVQDAIEEAIFKIDGEKKRLVVAGRTDAGVHATGQVCSVILNKDWQDYRLLDALNANLRKSGKVSIKSATKMPDDFNARFSAKKREYLYIIQNQKALLALNHGLAWRVPYDLDLEKMQKAANLLLGQHDFSTFRDSECQAASPIKTLDEFKIFKTNTQFGEQIHCTLKATSFLHRQVRSMVGSIVEVGRGYWDIDDLQKALDAKDRKACGQVAPSEGLYLTGVIY